MRVAVVLKQDQPTGKRTLGEIEALLTSSPWHPHGIKVRLKDGQVGRVQEILKEQSSQRHLGILLLRNSEKAWYFRELKTSDGLVLLSLGVDCDLKDAGQDDSMPREFARFVPNHEKLNHFQKALELSFEGANSFLRLSVFFGELSEVIDGDAKEWSRSGWIAQNELIDRFHQGSLTQETRMIVEEFLSAGILS